MPRILADLPADQIERLGTIAKAEGRSRASVLREAVSAYRAEPAAPGEPAEPDLSWLEAGFGLWKREGITTDPHVYERRRRAEWTRAWDDDYEEVRAESPEMFDAEDDRQRQIYLDMIAGKPVPPKYVNPE